MPKAGNNYSEQVVKNANFTYFICSVSEHMDRHKNVNMAVML